MPGSIEITCKKKKKKKEELCDPTHVPACKCGILSEERGGEKISSLSFLIFNHGSFASSSLIPARRCLASGMKELLPRGSVEVI